MKSIILAALMVLIPIEVTLTAATSLPWTKYSEAGKESMGVRPAKCEADNGSIHDVVVAGIKHEGQFWLFAYDTDSNQGFFAPYAKEDDNEPTEFFLVTQGDKDTDNIVVKGHEMFDSSKHSRPCSLLVHKAV